jgi:hypothetical protein
VARSASRPFPSASFPVPSEKLELTRGEIALREGALASKSVDAALRAEKTEAPPAERAFALGERDASWTCSTIVFTLSTPRARPLPLELASGSPIFPCSR